MPRTPWTALALTFLTTPCFGGLISVAPTMPPAGSPNQSIRLESPTASLQAAAMVRSFGNMHGTWNAAPVESATPAASITQPVVPVQRQDAAPNDETPSTILQHLPAATPATVTPLSKAGSRTKVSVTRKQKTTTPLNAQQTIPEPIMFAFVAFMAPILRPRHATRLATCRA